MKNDGGVTSASLEEFLGLSKADVAYIDTKAALKKSIKAYRVKLGITQADLANLLESSQSRVAKIEGGDSAVSIDLMLKALFALGLNQDDVAAVISPDIEIRMQQFVRKEVAKWNRQFKSRIDHLEKSIYQLAAQPKTPKAIESIKVISLKHDQSLACWQVQ